MWYTLGFYLVVKNNKKLTFAVNWIEPESIMLNKKLLDSASDRNTEWKPSERKKGTSKRRGRGQRREMWERIFKKCNKICVCENVTMKSISLYANQKLILKSQISNLSLDHWTGLCLVGWGGRIWLHSPHSSLESLFFDMLAWRPAWPDLVLQTSTQCQQCTVSGDRNSLSWKL